MKKDIHPKYNKNVKVTCSCGNTFEVGSTDEKIDVEVCSACHPFYTGTAKFIDTAGRVDKFRAKMKMAEDFRSKTDQPGAGKAKPRPNQTQDGKSKTKSKPQPKADQPQAGKSK